MLQDHSWLLLYKWYSNVSVMVRWGGQLSSSFRVEQDTRQGGLSSPFLFNLYYKDLIDVLSDKKCGINIDNHSYNVFCYADDILLASRTPTGLQCLIDTSCRLMLLVSKV